MGKHSASNHHGPYKARSSGNTLLGGSVTWNSDGVITRIDDTLAVRGLMDALSFSMVIAAT